MYSYKKKKIKVDKQYNKLGTFYQNKQVILSKH